MDSFFNLKSEEILDDNKVIKFDHIEVLKQLHRIGVESGGGTCCSHWSSMYIRFRLQVPYSCVDELLHEMIRGFWDRHTFNRNAVHMPNQLILNTQNALDQAVSIPLRSTNEQIAQYIDRNCPPCSFGTLFSGNHYGTWSRDYTGQVLTHNWPGKFFGVLTLKGIRIKMINGVTIINSPMLTPYKAQEECGE